MSRKTLSSLILAAAILLAVSAVATVVPYSNKMMSDLGYYTLCPFAPWSTLTLMALAGLGWIVRSYIESQPAQTE